MAASAAHLVLSLCFASALAINIETVDIGAGGYAAKHDKAKLMRRDLSPLLDSRPVSDQKTTSKVKQDQALAKKDVAAKPPAAGADPKAAQEPDATDASKGKQDQALATKDAAAKPPAAVADPKAAPSPDATDASKVKQDQALATKDQGGVEEKLKELGAAEAIEAAAAAESKAQDSIYGADAAAADAESKAQDAIEVKSRAAADAEQKSAIAAGEDASFASFKPACLYINLEHRTDRKLRMEAELDKVGLSCSRLEAFDKTARHGVAGEACRLSHLKALDLIAATEADYGMVFEDDAHWIQNISVVHDVLSHVSKSIKKHPVILLGCNDIETAEKAESGMREANGCVTATAYIIRKDYIPTLRNLWVKGSLWDPFFRDEWKVPIDIQWMKMQLKDHWGLTQPSLVHQSKGYSDIDHKVKNLVETETRGDSASIP